VASAVTVLTSPTVARTKKVQESAKLAGQSMNSDRVADDEQEGGTMGRALSLSDRIARWTNGRNRLDTPIPGLSLHRWEAPTEPESYMLAPSVCLIGQGRKRLFLGEEVYVYDAHRFLFSNRIKAIKIRFVRAIPTRERRAHARRSRRAGDLATPLLGARHPRRRRLRPATWTTSTSI
jgi:hypothetical protein